MDFAGAEAVFEMTDGAESFGMFGAGVSFPVL